MMIYIFKSESDIRIEGRILKRNGSNIPATVNMSAVHKSMAQTRGCAIYTFK